MPETIVAVGIDDPTLQLLTSDGYAVDTVEPEFDSIKNRMTATPPGTLILGNQSQLDGELIGHLRKESVDAPAILIANGPRDKNWLDRCVDFLESGGDDVVLPRPKEVALSVRKVGRRAHHAPDRIVRFQADTVKLKLNLTRQHIYVNDKRIIPTGAESVIMFILASTPGVVSRDAMVEEMWGWHQLRKNCIDIHVCRLRKQLGRAASLLATHWGIGYELVGRVH